MKTIFCPWAGSLTVVTAVSLIAGSAVAHHSSAPHFDHDNPITVDGVVTELRFVNPHGYVYFDVTADDGSVQDWRCELSAATALERRGWTRESIQPGQRIEITGSPARREEHVCFMSSFRLDGGPEYGRSAELADGVIETGLAEASDLIRPAFLDSGQPNLTGPWITLSFGMGMSRGFRDPYVPSDAGLAARDGYEMAFDDPILKCHVYNVINGWNHDRHINDIYQSEDAVTLQYGFMDFVRTIHLDMSEHPDDIVPSVGGHSIGRWEDETLVVDTTGFEQGILNHFDGTAYSDQTHLVERFHVNPDETVLVRDYTLVDPLFLAEPVNGQDFQALSSSPYEPYGCVELSGENNVRPE
ncbi:MAG: DUF6152 family protein [Gammaproteobacteria bacterium]